LFSANPKKTLGTNTKLPVSKLSLPDF